MDQKILDTFVEALFTPKAYDAGFELAKGLAAPDGTTLSSFVMWAEKTLPEAGEHPTLIGLPPLSAGFVAVSQGKELFRLTGFWLLFNNPGDFLLHSLRKMRSLEDDDRVVSAEDATSTLARPTWMVNLAHAAQNYLQILPREVGKTSLSKDKINEPLYRFFRREVATLESLLLDVRKDLELVVQACGGARQTNQVRRLLQNLTKGARWLKL